MEARFISDQSRRDGGLEYWRDLIGSALIWVTLVLGPIAVVPVLWSAPNGDFWIVAGGAAVAYLTLAGLYMFPSIPPGSGP